MESASPADLSKSGAIKKTADGFTYLDSAQFHDTSQPTSPRSRPLSWRGRKCPISPTLQSCYHHGCVENQPSWALVAGADRTINPDLERWYAARANSQRSKSRAPASGVRLQPKEVCSSDRRMPHRTFTAWLAPETSTL